MTNILKRTVGALTLISLLIVGMASFTSCTLSRDNAASDNGSGANDGGVNDSGTNDSGTNNNTDIGNSDNTTDNTPDEPVETRTPAPDFTVYDAQGNEVKLSDYLGTPVVINFWATWCPPCKNEMPDFQRAYVKYGYKIQFLMINVATDGDTVPVVKSFISKKGYTFPVFHDTDFDAADTYNVTEIPTTYFISADGYIVSYVVGSVSGDALNQEINKIRQ